MKKLLLALSLVLFALPAHAQSTLYSNSSSVGIGTSSPTSGVALDIGSNTNSMLLPIGTTGQRPTGVAGMLRYNSTNGVPEFYTSGWLAVPLTASSPIVINSTTGNIACPTCSTSSANVSSVSGDGTLYTNSASTGAVTLTLGSASAYSVWGNNTSSSATPAYITSPELSGTITDIQSIGATSTDGVVLTDTTAATSGNQKWSPRVRWTGQGWKTNSTAASQEVDAIAEVQPVQGTANPSFNWVLSGQINNGGYGPLLTVPSGGGLNLNSGVYEINGTQLAASNLLNGVTGSGSIVLSISPSLTTPNIGAATGTSLAVSGNITTSGGQVGIGTASPAVSLDLSHETDAVALPSGTSAQRPTAVAGMLRYNSTNGVPELYTSSWLPVPLTASSPLAVNSTTGNITCSTCNTSSANVNSVSGDGTLYTNSASTGAVTLTLGNASAYSVWGNNTSSSATPAYTTSPELSGTITDIQSIGATSTDGLVLTDTTAATSGNQKWSPRVRWTGQGWKTNSTAGSQEVDAIAEIQPVQGTANPTFNWVLSGQINGGGYGPLLTAPSGGGLNLNSGVYEINGTQLAASNLLDGVNGSGSIVLSTSPSLTTPNIGAATGTSLSVTGDITTSSGAVGIGTTSPGYPLQVTQAFSRDDVASFETSDADTGLGYNYGIIIGNTNNTVGNYFSISNLDSSGEVNAWIDFINVAQSGGVAADAQGAIAFETRNGYYIGRQMYIDPNGKVGIGTTSPAQTLEVNGTAKVDTGLIVPLIYPPSDSTTAVQIDKANGTSNVVDIDTTNGRVGIATTSPSYTLDVAGSIRTTQALLNSSAVPTISTCGTSPPAATTGSNNNGGQFTLGTGATAACTVTFANAFPNYAYCTVTPASSYTGTYYISAQSKSAFTVTLGTGTASVKFNYACGGN